jgi:hypothetical protein
MMQDAFVRAGELGSVTPIHMFYREWAVVVEIERHPEAALRLHEAERALMSDDPQVRDAAVRDAGEIVRAAHAAVAGECLALGSQLIWPMGVYRASASRADVQYIVAGRRLASVGAYVGL